MKIDNLPFPGCMMPDGAPPCDSYINLHETAKNLEQQNEALLAQVDELREALEFPVSYNPVEPIDRRKFFVDIQWLDEARELRAKTPQQSLDSLKARIEEETIGRCVTITQKYCNDGGSSLGAYVNLRNIPRKYQPSNDTKADK